MSFIAVIYAAAILLAVSRYEGLSEALRSVLRVLSLVLLSYLLLTEYLTFMETIGALVTTVILYFITLFAFSKADVVPRIMSIVAGVVIIFHSYTFFDSKIPTDNIYDDARYRKLEQKVEQYKAANDSISLLYEQSTDKLETIKARIDSINNKAEITDPEYKDAVDFLKDLIKK